MPFVLSCTKKPLMPCTPKRARLLLERGRAAVYKRYPFTIVLNDRDEGELQPVELKVDPGSKITGMALVVHGEKEKRVVEAFHLEHRGQQIQSLLEKRRTVRRSRRNRKTRYRAPRFLNRTREKKWLPPSLLSRIYNVKTWALRFVRFSPLTQCAVETMRFDTQKIQNPEISGVEYQQGQLIGYEVREYLLEKWSRQCAYCAKQNIPFEVEHIVPKSKGGTNRVSNLTLSCRSCNENKGSKTLQEFLSKKPDLLKKIENLRKLPLKDAAAVNATRYATGNVLKLLQIPTVFSSGGRTKFNRIQQNYEKQHWIDAACVGESGEKVSIPQNKKCRLISAKGHGDRQVCLVDKHGFPRSKPATKNCVFGFRSGDMVQAVVPTGKKQGRYRGRVAIRSRGFFNITTKAGLVQGISYQFCKKLHSKDGYSYATVV